MASSWYDPSAFSQSITRRALRRALASDTTAEPWVFRITL